MAKPGTKPGTKFTAEHVRNMVKARKNNPRWERGVRKAARKNKGRKPAHHTVAASLATRRLKKKGLTRKEYPKLWQRYYMEELEARLKPERAAA